MPIAALSESDSHKIRSTLALNDAISVIKELIDNAFDSYATSISIEVSANTLDVIQVKDNGSGIGVEDRQLLCKRGFTSKITSLEDLAQLGGTFLGFRGEALASIAELSKGINIITRVDGERTGTALTFDSDGKLISSSSVSQPTGTTVRVTGFLCTLPVRKQNAVKQATKTLSAIKKLLFQYAFARPTIKLQFKVLKSKSDFKDNWSFAPNRNAEDLVLLAAKIVGKDVVGNCRQQTATSQDGSTQIHALLVKPDADISKTASSDQYISVDGRPLSATRGTMKELHKTYRTYLQRNVCTKANQAATQFLLLRLVCPTGSYDVNIEPAKDEVMFDNAGGILCMFEELCERFYGQQGTEGAKQRQADGTTTDLTNRDFDILLSRKKPAFVASETQSSPQFSKFLQSSSPSRSTESDGKSNETPPNAIRFSSQEHVGQANHSADTNEETSRSFNHKPRTHGFEDDSEEDVMHPQITNPFVLAKMNCSDRSDRSMPSEISLCPNEPAPSFTVNHARKDRCVSDIDVCQNLLPSPRSSPERGWPFQNPGPPNRPWKARDSTNSDAPSTSTKTPAHDAQNSAQLSLLQAWKTSMSSAELPGSSKDQAENEYSSILKPQITHPQNRTAAKVGVVPFAIDTAIAKTPQKPFRSPLKNPQSGSSHVVGQLATRSGHALSPDEELGGNTVAQGSCSLPLESTQADRSYAELDEIMDFEHRKRSTILQHRSQGRLTGLNDYWQTSNSTGDNSRSGSSDHLSSRKNEQTSMGDIPPQPNSASYTQNPHWNRYKRAIAGLDDSGTILTSLDADHAKNADLVSAGDHEMHKEVRSKKLSNLPANDPRSYLLRKIDRIGDAMRKSSAIALHKLPFESIDRSIATFDIFARLKPEDLFRIPELKIMAESAMHYDPYIREGPSLIAEPTHSLETLSVAEYEDKIRSLCSRKGLQPDGEGLE